MRGVCQCVMCCCVKQKTAYEMRISDWSSDVCSSDRPRSRRSRDSMEAIMATYIVTYDLHTEGQNYNCLYEKLEAYGTRWHMQRSVWIIRTDQSAVQVRDNLKACLDANDKLFVGQLSGEAAWSGYSDNITQWLKANL